MLKLSHNILPRPLSLLDIGARDGIQWPWDQISPELLNLILVEPDPIEAKKLEEKIPVKTNHRGGTTILPVALWRDKQKLTLNINRSPGTSSIFPANLEFLSQFPEVERFELIKKFEIATTSIDILDSEGKIPSIDFAKIDVQGAELAVCEGAISHFSKNLVGLEIEVEFAPLYLGQPLFIDIDNFVRNKLGLELWDLRKTYWKYTGGIKAPGPTKGRLVFGDALYLRPLNRIVSWLESMSFDSAKEKIVTLVISSMVYGYYDYALSILDDKQIQSFIDPHTTNGELRLALNRLGKSFRPIRYGSGRLYGLFDLIAKMFKPTHNGWASTGQNLGSRKQGGIWR